MMSSASAATESDKTVPILSAPAEVDLALGTALALSRAPDPDHETVDQSYSRICDEFAAGFQEEEFGKAELQVADADAAPVVTELQVEDADAAPAVTELQVEEAGAAPVEVYENPYQNTYERNTIVRVPRDGKYWEGRG